MIRRLVRARTVGRVSGKSAIEPDTKNWTWVLERSCPDCAFDAQTIDVHAAGAMIRRIAAEWHSLLDHPHVQDRPLANVWSTLEYGCHVRDVFVIFDQRLELMLTEDNPKFVNWDQDRTAVESNYGAQDPLKVGDELTTAATRLAARFDQVFGDEWLRRGTRSDGAQFSVGSFASYLLHDPIHHLWDVSGHDSTAQAWVETS